MHINDLVFIPGRKGKDWRLRTKFADTKKRWKKQKEKGRSSKPGMKGKIVL